MKLMETIGLLQPEILEVQQSLTELLQAAAAEAVRVAVVEFKQAEWNLAHSNRALPA